MYNSIIVFITTTSMKLMLMIKKYILNYYCTCYNKELNNLYKKKQYLSLSLLNCVPCVPACQRCLRANELAWQRGLRAKVPKAGQLLIFTCKHANKRANVSCSSSMFQLGVPTCETVCQYFNLAYQHTKRRADFLNNPLTKC